MILHVNDEIVMNENHDSFIREFISIILVDVS